MVAYPLRVRALSLVPVALLSAAWSADLVTSGTANPRSTSSPAVTRVQEPPIPAAPSSIATGPASDTRVEPARQGRVRPAAAVVERVPTAALAAYRRAATVINWSDAACGLGWDLLAGIGEVESDHGRSVPRVAGRLPDTDGGQYDGDTTHDRGVGPFQFLPATWTSVRVDADGDGTRDPADLDDAALGAAVYLCSGDEDLATADGRRTALARYNPAPGYAALVLEQADAYAASTYTATPVLAAAAVAGPARAPVVHARRPAATPSASPTPRAPARPAKPTREPTVKPTPKPAPTPAPASTAKADPVAEVLTATGATLLCTLRGLSRLADPGAFAACLAQHRP